MSKLVCHMGKYTRGNVFGIQKHNQRENKNYSNENVDLEKTKFNYDLANNHKIKYLDKVDKVIKNNRTNTNRAVRKDAIVFVDTVVGSDKEFFNNLTEQEQRRFFEESYKYLESKVDSKNIISATVHMDEGNPHMHFSFVPINEDGSLSAKKKINRNFLREIQEEFSKYLKNKGFDIERGLENSLNKHLEPLEYKKKQLIKDIEEINSRYESLQNISKSLSKEEEHIKGVFDKVDSIEAKPVMFNKDKIALSQIDYSYLKKMAKIGEAKVIENKQLKAKVGQIERELNQNRINEDDLKKVLNKNLDLKLENERLKSNYRTLNKSFERVEKAVERLGVIEEVNKEIRNIKLHERSRSYDMER